MKQIYLRSILAVIGVFCLLPLSFRCDCPHSGRSSSLDSAPSKKPKSHYIQTTFIYRDIGVEDEFSQLVSAKISELRPVLKKAALVTIENENIDCSQNEYQRCFEYPLDKPYHFIIVEDSRNGAAVYSIDNPTTTEYDKKSFSKKLAIIEAALLDVLSRHSPYPLVDFASDDASNEVGFVREIPSSELERYIMQNYNRNSQVSQNVIEIRSPMELNLLNSHIVEHRSRDFILNHRNLITFHGDGLTKVIEETKNTVFVLFWTDVNNISLHVFELWSRASLLTRDKPELKNEEIILGEVACHDAEQIDICKAFAVSHKQYFSIIAFKNGNRVASQASIGEPEFYLRWIQMVLYGPIINLSSISELERAKEGFLPFYEGQQTAVTIGSFASRSSDEFKNFKIVANILNGRYHIISNLNSEKTSISTYLPLEGKVRQYQGSFEVKSMLNFITRESLPSLYDIGAGFTFDIVFRANRSTFLLILNEAKEDELLRKFRDMAKTTKDQLFATANREENPLEVKSLLEELKLSTSTLPALCLINVSKEIICAQDINIHNLADMLVQREENGFFNHKFSLDSTVVNPLIHLQKHHIDRVFGEQKIKLFPLFPEQITSDNHHHLDKIEGKTFTSGCPMMAHLQRHEEL